MQNSAHRPGANIPGLKQFRQDGCYSYLFFDSVTGQGLLVDPRTDLVENYKQSIAELRIRLELVLDTRMHWHHLSGSHLIAETYGVPIAMAANTLSERATRRLAHGEVLKIGQWDLQVLATPGTGPDALCLFGAGLLLSGDTVSMGTGARTDQAGGSAEALWASLHEVLAKLPDETLVFPAHDRQDLLFSTLAVEKKRGPDWAFASALALAQAKSEEKPPRGDGEIRHRLHANQSAHPPATSESHFGNGSVSSPTTGVATISVEKVESKINEGSPDNCFVDVREADEIGSGKIPGTRNIPLSELAFHLAELASFKRIYLSCQSGRRSQLAARTLDYLGLRDVVHVSGGFKAWKKAGLKTE